MPLPEEMLRRLLRTPLPCVQVTPSGPYAQVSCCLQCAPAPVTRPVRHPSRRLVVRPSSQYLRLWVPWYPRTLSEFR